MFDLSLLVGRGEEKIKIHWIAWHHLCKPKKQGGLSFRSMKQFNEALLAKQGWRLIQREDSLVSRVFKGYYFPLTSFLHAKLGSGSSFPWRSIVNARTVLD